MNKAELKKALDKAIEAFITDTKADFQDPYSKTPATEADMVELSRQVTYTLQEFRDAILEYLD